MLSHRIKPDTAMANFIWNQILNLMIEHDLILINDQKASCVRPKGSMTDHSVDGV